MEKQNEIDYESIKQKALEQFRTGQSLTGKGGAFAPLFKQFLEAALEAELQAHLGSDSPEQASNRKNAKATKTVKSGDGEFSLTSSPVSHRLSHVFVGCFFPVLRQELVDVLGGIQMHSL